MRLYIFLLLSFLQIISIANTLPTQSLYCFIWQKCGCCSWAPNPDRCISYQCDGSITFATCGTSFNGPCLQTTITVPTCDSCHFASAKLYNATYLSPNEDRMICNTTTPASPTSGCYPPWGADCSQSTKCFKV